MRPKSAKTGILGGFGRKASGGTQTGRRPLPHKSPPVPAAGVFHSVENYFPYCGKIGPNFPHYGNFFSIVWKNREKVFHCVENFRAAELERISIFCSRPRWGRTKPKQPRAQRARLQ
jgi:hypothetical protein